MYLIHVGFDAGELENGGEGVHLFRIIYLSVWTSSLHSKLLFSPISTATLTSIGL